MAQETTAIRLDAIDRDLKAQGKPTTPNRNWHPNPVSWQPGGLYNAMIAPLTPFRIRGAIWYQGETNSAPDKVTLYSRLFPAMITDWRRNWAEGDFPFLFVQISSFYSPGENWGLLRDAQRRSLRLANTGMAVTIDAGLEHNVHPSNKQVVGERLSLLARNIVFGEKIVANGPLFRTAWHEGNTMHAQFDYAEGLKSNGPLADVEVAGADGRFVPATAHIEGQTIVATTPSISEPRYIRYAWTGFTPAPLFNGAGLPASTFSSYPEP
jgi:sialate O-acetylesterase